jgi:DNA-binding Lrp family transcriptional regulator
MDAIDKQLLNYMQHDFPLVSRPYAKLGELVGISESDALARVKNLVESDVIRKVGPSFDTRQMGYASALIAARVPEERLDEVAELVSSYPEVTHNYGRNDEINLWFTVIARSMVEIEKIVNEIKTRSGIEEIGMIRELSEFDKETKGIIRTLLEQRYYVPKVLKIVGTKERYGGMSWAVETDRGVKTVITKGLNESLSENSAGRYFITDVEGNRYEIDPAEISPESAAWIESVI